MRASAENMAQRGKKGGKRTKERTKGRDEVAGEAEAGKGGDRAGWANAKGRWTDGKRADAG